MDFRRATGHELQWIGTGISQGFSNFLFVDQYYWLVLRTVLVKKEQYLAHLQQIRTWDGTSIEEQVVEKLRGYLIYRECFG